MFGSLLLLLGAFGERRLPFSRNGYDSSMSDPRRALAAEAGPRLPRRVRGVGWAASAVLWLIASDGRPLLLLGGFVVALLLRGGYVIVGWGKGRSVFWSPWFFAVAALAEFIWLFAG